MNLATLSPILFLAAAFTLATILEPISSARQRQQSKTVMELLFGDARKLFANHFFTKADVYFHNGYYPSIFDQAQKPGPSHLTEQAEAESAPQKNDPSDPSNPSHESHPSHDSHHEESTFLQPPHDFIEAFGRHFFVSKHTHMENANARELLPWFKIAAELDPNRIETYTVAAYWLRSVLKKVDEAEAFLREGWRANPDSYAILFELGRLYYFDRHDPTRARNLWELALRYWDAQEKNKPDPDLQTRAQILAHLADLEEKQGNLPKAISYLEQLAPLSPHPDEIRQQIQQRKSKLNHP